MRDLSYYLIDMKKFILILYLIVFPIVGLYATDKEQPVEREYFYFISEHKQFLPTVEQALLSARSDLIEILNDSLSYKPKIFIAADLKNFRELIGTAFPDWGAAAALPYREMIVIKSPAHFNLGKSLDGLVRHEYAHLALQNRLHLGHPPRWLDEGVAMYAASEWNWEDNFAMSRAVVFRTLVPLREIESLNRFPQGRAQTAYAQSYLAVQYFLDEYGIEAFNMFLDELQRRSSIDAAFDLTIGENYDKFEKEFVEYLNSRYNLMTLFGDLYFIWIFLAAVVFIGFILKIRKRQKFYKKWEEEEKLQSTDFDYGDPDNPEQVEDEDKPWL
jgi:hypothetical protein